MKLNIDIKDLDDLIHILSLHIKKRQKYLDNNTTSNKFIDILNDELIRHKKLIKDLDEQYDKAFREM